MEGEAEGTLVEVLHHVPKPPLRVCGGDGGQCIDNGPLEFHTVMKCCLAHIVPNHYNQEGAPLLNFLHDAPVDLPLDHVVVFLSNM